MWLEKGERQRRKVSSPASQSMGAHVLAELLVYHAADAMKERDRQAAWRSSFTCSETDGRRGRRLGQEDQLGDDNCPFQKDRFEFTVKHCIFLNSG